MLLFGDLYGALLEDRRIQQYNEKVICLASVKNAILGDKYK